MGRGRGMQADGVGPSRRAVVRGASATGLAALTAGVVGAGSAEAAPLRGGTESGGAVGESGARGRHLVFDYRPSQPTGWPRTGAQAFDVTLGGHVVSADFEQGGVPHRIALLPLGPGGAQEPVYLATPSGDPEVDFRATLEAAWGTRYAFRYRGGLGSRDRFCVQSYSVFTRLEEGPRPVRVFGGGVYLEYLPGSRSRRGAPGSRDNLRWIQVCSMIDPLGRRTEVDNSWAANPYYLIGGGLASINGRTVLNFHDTPQIGIDGPMPGPTKFVAEAFLVHDTGAFDASGRAVVDIYGGIKHGWEAKPL